MGTVTYTEKIRGIDRAIEWHAEEVEAWKRVKIEAEATQAEAEKPELRHGDIRLWNPSGDIGIVDMSEPNPHMIWESHDLRNAKNKDNILSQSKSIGTLQEIFDDLKALSEPLKKFTVDNGPYRTVEVTIQPHGLLRLQDDDGFMLMGQCDIPAFILNLRRLLHTAEQEQAKT